MTLDEIAEDFVQRLRRGNQPSVAEYVEKFPEFADDIRATLPALAVLEQVGLGSEDSAIHQPRWSAPDLSEIGDYRIIGEIGRGGMGVVYEAEQKSLGRTVALKVLPRLAGGESGSARFRREARAAAQLHHTNIVPVFEVGQDGEHEFYAMQLIQGQGLDSVIADLKRLREQTPQHGCRTEDDEASNHIAKAVLTGRFRLDLSSSTPSDLGSHPHSTKSADETGGASQSGSALLLTQSDGTANGSESLRYYRSVARIGLQVADALAYAHARGIVHRDIKPSNLLLEATGVVWVADFGLAKTDDIDLTQTGDLLGTLRYMSPERFKRQCDAQADIYALGVTLYELLVMEPAYSNADRLQLVQAIINSPLPAPSRRDPSIPLDLETIVLKATDKEPRDRYASAEAMADDLRRFINDEAIQARRMTNAEKIVRWSRRNRGLAFASSIAGALLVTLVAVLLWTSIRQDHLRRVAEARSEQLRESLYLSRMNTAGHAAAQRYGVDTIRAQLDEWRPGANDKDLRHWEWYYLYSVSHQAAFVSERLGNAFVWQCDSSADGSRVVVTVNGWGIQVRSTETGEVLGAKRLGSARSVDWSSDGDRIAVGRFDDTCTILDAATLDVRAELSIPGLLECRCVQLSPNGKLLAESGRHSDVESSQQIRIHDLEIGAVTQTLDGQASEVWALAWSPDGSRLASSGLRQTLIWDVGDGNVVSEFKGTGPAWSPDGKVVACIRPTGIWDALSGNQIAAIQQATVVRWARDSRRFAVGCDDGAIQLFRLSSLEPQGLLLGHNSAISSLAWNRDDSAVASCGLQDETIRLWHLDQAGHYRLIRGRDSNYAADLSQCEDTIGVVAGYGGIASLWGVDGSLRSERQIGGNVRDIALSHDGRRVAFSGVWPGIRIWNVQTDAVEELPCDVPFWQLAWNRDGRLAGVSDDGDISIWDASGRSVQSIEATRNGAALQVAWHPTTGELASMGLDLTLKMWNPRSGKLLWQSEPAPDICNELQFSQDGERLASAHLNAVVIWDAISGKQLSQFDELRENFVSVDWSPDGRRLVTGSAASTAVWDTQAGRVALRLDSPGRFNAVRWTNDGQRIVVAGRGVVIFDASHGYELNRTPR